jgi:hypothetical protein
VLTHEQAVVRLATEAVVLTAAIPLPFAKGESESDYLARIAAEQRVKEEVSII